MSGMNEEFAEMLTTAETEGIESIEEVLRETKFVDANRERCVKANKEMYGVLARYTNSEALTIVKSVSEMDGVRAWVRLHANCSRRTLGRMFRVQRECMYPKLVILVPRATCYRSPAHRRIVQLSLCFSLFPLSTC